MENNNQVQPVETPTQTASALETKKWYQHKAVLPVTILFVVAAAISWIALSRQTKNDSSLVPALNKDITIKGTLKPAVEGCSFIVIDNNQNYVLGKKPDDTNYGDYIQATGKLSTDPNICGTANLFIINEYKVLTKAAPDANPSVNATSMSDIQGIYFGKGYEKQYTLVNMDDGQSKPFIPQGYSVVNQHEYSQFPTFLILQKDKNLFSYNVGNGQITNIPSLALQTNESPNIEPSITEKDKFFIEIVTYPPDNIDEIGGTPPTKVRSYFYDATANTLSNKTNLGLENFDGCVKYDSLNQRFFSWPCGEGIGSSAPLSIANYQGKAIKVVLSMQDLGLSNDSFAKLEYNNGLFFGYGGQDNDQRIIILNPQSVEPTKTVYTINPSVIAAQNKDATHSYLDAFNSPYSIALSTTNKTIIIGGGYSVLLLHYNEKNQIYEGKDLPDNSLYANFIFPYMGKLYYQSQDGAIKIINLDTWQLQKTIPSSRNEEITLFSSQNLAK
jgi:hypothetical protein